MQYRGSHVHCVPLYFWLRLWASLAENPVRGVQKNP